MIDRKRTSWSRPLILVLLFSFLSSGLLLAQAEKGALYGRVTNTEGERLPGVSITLAGLGADQLQMTDEAGEFRFLGLAPGNYKIEAQLDGHATVVYEAVNIRIGRNTTIDLQLNPAIEDVITVTTESPLLDERKIVQGMQVTQLELQKIPTARDPWAIAGQTPGVLMDRINVGGNESGQQPNFVGTGANGTQNVFLVDGVDITDQTAQGGSATYFGFEQFEEMSFTTGGTDIEIQTAGVQISLVTRRGTNEWRGSGSSNFTDESFQSSGNLNLTDLPGAQIEEAREDLPEGAALDDAFTGNQIDRIEQWGVETGGFLIKDRLWLWGSIDRNEISQSVFGGQPDNTQLDNEAVKLNAQVSQANSFVFTYNNGEKVKTGRDAGPDRPAETTFNQGGPSPLKKIEDTHVFNSSFFLTGSWSDMKGGFFLEPQGGRDAQVYVDADNVYHGSYYFLDTLRPSERLKVDGSVFFGAGATNHELKFGASHRTAENSSLWGAPGDGVVSYAGELFDLTSPEIVGYAWRQKDTRSKVESDAVWAQDTFTTDRLTVNVGARYDKQTGANSASTVPGSTFGDQLVAVNFPGNDPGFEFKAISPRIGVTYALGAERKTLLRGSFSQFSDGLGNPLIEEVNPTGFSFGVYYGVDLNGNGILDPDEPAEFQNPSGFTPGADPNLATNRIDPNLDPVITDELIVGVEHSFLPELVAGVSYIYRRGNDYYQEQPLFSDANGVVRPLEASDYFLEGFVSGTLPDGTSYNEPYYAVNPGLTNTGGILVTNSDRDTVYQGLTLTTTKRLSNKWMLRGHVTFYDWEWNIGEGFRRFDDPTNVLNDNDENHEWRADDDGGIYAEESGGSGNVSLYLNSRWSFNLAGLYQLPWGVNVAANINGREGYPVPFFHTTTRSNGAAVQVQVGEVDSFRVDDIYTVDARLDKDLQIGDLALTLSLDAFNLFNDGYVVQVENNLGGGRAGFVDQILGPRIFRLGLRVGWK